MAGTRTVKILQEMIAEKRSQIESLEIQIAAHEAAIRRISGEPEHTAKRARRSNVKTTVLDLLTEAGDQGLNAIKAVEMALKKGERLERGTVSSLLSRLKSDGIVSYDGSVYRLVKAGNEQAPERTVNGSF